MSLIDREFTNLLQKVVRQVVSDPKTYRGVQYLPAVQIPAQNIRVDVIEATGGLTNEHEIGTDPQYVQSFGTRTQEFQFGSYREAIHYDEQKILFLRKLGENDRSQRGVRQYINEDVDRLNRRLEARIEKLRWDAIFSGSFSHLGKTASFGIPSGNTALPIGAVWSTDLINANAAANPVKDIRYWVTGGLAAFRKYKITKLVMNPNTVRWVLDNANTLSYLTSYGANPKLVGYDINTVLGLLIPGCPPVDVYEGWYQTESVDANGKITVSNATYFLPDGKIFFEAALPGGDKIGEFVLGVNLQSGSVDDPGFGKYLIVEDKTALNPKNPYLDLIGGFQGGPKVDRSFDVLTGSVV